MTKAVRAFRAPMRSRRPDVPAGAAIERALTHGLCGCGGILTSSPRSLTSAVESVAAQYDERTARRLERFAAAPNGVFVWTRDIDGLLWLGRLEGGWWYDERPGAAAADLVHVRRCTWLESPVAPSEAPPPVLVAFARGGLNWQEIHGGDAGKLTSQLWDAAG